MKSAALAERAGITYRQLDYWQHRSFIDGPSPGSGRDRDWAQDEIDQVLMMSSLVHAGLRPESAARVCRSLMSVQRHELAPGILITLQPTTRRQPERR